MNDEDCPEIIEEMEPMTEDEWEQVKLSIAVEGVNEI